MTVQELYIFLDTLIKSNKGDYTVKCESFCVNTDIESIETDEEKKEISL